MITGGFFNSIDGDIKYNARQMGEMFDGIITDGVFTTVGDAFSISPKSGYTITIGTGRAWYNHTWVYNDDIYDITLDTPTGGYNRIDLVCIFINDAERSVDFKIVSGAQTTGSMATIPSVPDDRYHPIGRINVRNDRQTQGVVDGDITYGIFNAVTGLLQQLSLPAIQAKFDSLYSQSENSRNDAYRNAEAARNKEFNDWYKEAKEHPIVPVISSSETIPAYEGSIWIEEG